MSVVTAYFLMAQEPTHCKTCILDGSDLDSGGGGAGVPHLWRARKTHTHIWHNRIRFYIGFSWPKFRWTDTLNKCFKQGRQATNEFWLELARDEESWASLENDYVNFALGKLSEA